ncbi:MAG: DUF3883 domain-containing protein [Rhodoferax sp.]|nr:DUF3883 domain-containing protein [Rhodoferax sp.]
MIALSPGIAGGCFDLIRMASQHPVTFAQMRAEFPRIGGIDIGRLSEIAQTLGWLRANDSGIAVLTPRGANLVEIGCTHLRLRQAILDYVEVIRPPWIKNAIDGRLKTVNYAPTEISQSLVEAELAVGYDDEIVAFWDRLAAIARGLRNASLSEIGREGEKLTIAHELHRTSMQPKWVSIESNSTGYDVLSVVSSTDTRHLPIEVKASTAGMRGAFYLTRNEWDESELMPLHQFHLWDLSSRTNPNFAIVPRKEVEKHVPADSGKGKWKEVEISFGIFASFFASPQ